MLSGQTSYTVDRTLPHDVRPAADRKGVIAALVIPLLAQFGAPSGDSTSPTTEPDALNEFLKDNGTTVGAILTIVFVGLGLVLLYASLVRNKRARLMAPTAEKHGLRFSGGDLFGCTQTAFPLFLEGDGRVVENVMSRTAANGLDVRVFDFAYYTEYKDDQGKIRKIWTYFNCAMARHNGLWPVIRVSKERMLDKVAQKMGLPDIELESEEFNRTFIVQCADRRFATTLLDPQMMEFILSTQGRLTFETKGRWLLVISPRLDNPADMVGLLGVADEFLKRIPPVIYELYDEGADTEGGDAPLPTDGILLNTLGVVAQAMREEGGDWRDPTPDVDYDLDGNPVNATEPPEENPWG